MVELKKVNGGSARLTQLGVLVFLVPFSILLLYIVVSKELSFDGIVFLGILIAVSWLIVWRAFLFADIYLSREFIIVKNIFFSKRRNIKDIKKVKKAILPLIFIIKFKDGSRIILFGRVLDKLQHLIRKNHENTAIELLATKVKAGK